MGANHLLCIINLDTMSPVPSVLLRIHLLMWNPLRRCQREMDLHIQMDALLQNQPSQHFHLFSKAEEDLQLLNGERPTDIGSLRVVVLLLCAHHPVLFMLNSKWLSQSSKLHLP